MNQLNQPNWRTSLFISLCVTCLLASHQVLAQTPQAMPPGDAFELPAMATTPGAPRIFEYNRQAGPDQTLFLVGDNLSRDVAGWGVSPNAPGGEKFEPKVQFLTGGYMALTIPEKSMDGPMLIWVKNKEGASAPIVLNAPQPWWCGPDEASPAAAVTVFGRNLLRRPDGQRAYVYLCQPGQPGVWIDGVSGTAHAICFNLPPTLAAGEYQVWVHAGCGGTWGWGGPVKLRVAAAAKKTEPQHVTLTPGASGTDIQAAMDALSQHGGGEIHLPAGEYPLHGTLRIPAGITLVGHGQEKTSLQLQHSEPRAFTRFAENGWNQAPSAFHTVGDVLNYDVAIPKAGRWTVWLRYATEMSTWKQPGMSGRSVLIVDNGQPVPLENLPNTGSFSTFKWSSSAVLDLTAGKHSLAWKNIGGGGLTTDAYVFALDPAFKPSDAPYPQTGDGLLVLQAEDCASYVSKSGHLPGNDHAVVWLAGNGASICDLSVLGNSQVNVGIVMRNIDPTTWLDGCRTERVRVADCEGKQAENCGILVRKVSHAIVSHNELWGRAPIFISGAKQTTFDHNKLVSVTRFGGGAEAAILGRNETIEQCRIESNDVASPPGADAGGPTARRLIWLSTGHGSITHNYLADNGITPGQQAMTPGAGQPRFGGVAGTDANVGETILFEGNHRTAYFGALAGADAQSVLLPETVPATPDDRLGSVKRDQLAHNAAGEETPFLPPDVDDGSLEPPMGEYYVSIFAGPGQGQTRRVIRREGQRLLLDAPWRVAPTKGSIATVGTGFYQNLIVGNHTPDGMTGVQLWISCIENVVEGNTIARQRKQGMYFYANGSTLASSMPRSWNRGISPLFWNIAEGNCAEECSDGAIVTSGDGAGLPIEFPRALGNVLRHNTFMRSRFNGVVAASRKSANDLSASVVGTIVEFNQIRDTPIAHHAGNGSDATVFRREQAYFWNLPEGGKTGPVAFQIDPPGATVAIEQNHIEGPTGVMSKEITEIKRPEDAPKPKTGK